MFGTQNVYNPWSVVNYVSEAVSGVQFPKPYWSNTSSNSIIKELVERADLKQREELESLIAGAAIDKPIHEDITYEDIYKSEDNLWNFLLFTGYLKMIDRYMKEDSWYATMAIPNTEVKYIYRNTVMAWSDRKIGARDFKEFFWAMEDGDTNCMEQVLTEVLSETISFYDYAENYYHGFLAGLLKCSDKYLVKSNRENGLGRTDLILRTPSVRGRAIVFEIKTAASLREMEAEC